MATSIPRKILLSQFFNATFVVKIGPLNIGIKNFDSRISLERDHFQGKNTFRFVKLNDQLAWQIFHTSNFSYGVT